MVSFSMIPALAVSMLAALAAASPVNNQPRGDGTVIATLIGAADAQYSVAIPLNGEFTLTNNVLSISHIATTSGPCTFYGVDGVQVDLPAYGGYVDVGPPQTIFGGYCGGPW